MKWPTAQLSQGIADVVRGVTFSQGDSIHESRDGFLPVLRAGNIAERLETERDLVWISERLVSDKQRLRRNDIVMCTSSGSALVVGKTAIAENDFDGSWGAFNAVLRPTSAVVPKFLYFWLQTGEFKAWRDRQARGAHIKNIRHSDLANLAIPFPAKSEQYQIVELLDEADRLRKLRHVADAKAARILPTLFLKMFGDPTTNPMMWPERQLSKVIQSVEAGWSAPSEGRPREGEEYGVLKVSAVTSGVFLPEQNKAVINVDSARSLIIPKRGDLLFSRANTRELVAATCVVESNYRNLFLPDKLWRLVPVPGEASGVFLKELFWRDGIRDKFRAASSGSSGSMLNISQDAMLRTTVPVPPFHLQERFESLAWSVMDARNRAECAAEGIDLMWLSLLQRAFSGQLTARWREAHMQEVLAEMEEQARALNLLIPKELEAQ